MPDFMAHRATPVLRTRASRAVATVAASLALLALSLTFASAPVAAGIPTQWSITQSANLPNPGSASELNSISCVSATFCMAVGSGMLMGNPTEPLAEEWNGLTWTVVSTPQPPDYTEVPLESVSCSSATFCVAVGYATSGSEPNIGLPFVEQWNGISWTEAVENTSLLPPGGIDGRLYGVDCASASFCMATGAFVTTAQVPTALAVTWNGANWVTSPAQTNFGAGQTLSSVSCVSATTCTAVGNWTGNPGGPFAEQFNNGTWTITLSGINGAQSASDGVLTSVSCPAAGGCMAVGYTATSGLKVAYGQWWNGSSWASVNTTGLTANQNSLFSSVSCTPGNGCTATGQISSGAAQLNLAASWTGKSFVEATTPNPNNGSQNIPGGISCLTNVSCIIAGYSGTSPQQTMVLTGPVTPLGYWLAGSDGGIFTFGNALFYGSTGGITLNAPIVGMAATPDGQGYWLVGSDGGIFTFGDAGFYGSTGSITLNKPIVGMATTPDGRGYWLVGSDGGIFSFGDAAFYGSTGGITLNKPVVGMASTADGHGYWLVASDGGIFSYGDATFYGSTGGLTLNKPVVAMGASSDGHGYWLVASDGGIFSFGDAIFYGSTGSLTLAKPIAGIMVTNDGLGYWLYASDGGAFAFGDATFLGSLSGTTLNKPIVTGATA
jgi:hypothetical protein